MGATVIGSVEQAYPFRFSAPIVEIKKNWSGDWEYFPELEFMGGSEQASANAFPSVEIKRRYGDLKHPHQSDLEEQSSWDLDKWWVRVKFVGEQGETVVFVGRIDDEARAIKGRTEHPAGVQEWVAFGGLRILEKIDVSRSFHAVDGEKKEIGWLPDMNSRDRRGLVVGNRSDQKFAEDDGEGTYLYGGTSNWTHLQYLEYVVKHFVQQENGPTWTIGGQKDILSGMRTTIEMPQVLNVNAICRRLIPPEYGLDYRVRFTEEGFEINIFSLITEESSFSGSTMPKNPNTVSIKRDDAIDLVETQIVKTSEHRVDKIRVIGKRIVVCFSLKGARALLLDESATPGEDAAGATIVKKWIDALETSYKAGRDGAETNADNDEERRSDKFKGVFQQFGAPVGWDLNGGSLALRCGLDGFLIENSESDPAVYQTAVRRTLPWLPLRVGYDYSQVPAVNNNPDGHEPEMQAPAAYLYLENDTENETSPQYVQAEKHGIAVGIPHMDWGVFLNASPNHLLAYNHWSSEDEETSDTVPIFDYETLVATIAIESDHRLQLGYDVPESLRSGDGSRMDILDEDAEMWVLAPKTIVGVEEGVLLDSGPDIRVLRTDTDRLNLVMAGAIARYINKRVRAKIVYNGLMPWGDLVGSVLTVVETGGDTQKIGAPITSVTWIPGKIPQTVICTGYAG